MDFIFQYGFVFSVFTWIHCHWQCLLTEVAVPEQDEWTVRSHDEDLLAHPDPPTPALGSSAITGFVP
jgi:hypothetical protein